MPQSNRYGVITRIEQAMHTHAHITSPQTVALHADLPGMALTVVQSETAHIQH